LCRIQEWVELYLHGVHRDNCSPKPLR
jgi:hypothetical protein